MFIPRAFPSLLLMLMGSLDCATTAVGILYFGAVEMNPFLAGIANANIIAFIALKLTTTAFITLIFSQAEKILMQTPNRKSRAFTWAHNLLKAAYVSIMLLLLIVVANNIIILVHAL